MKARARFVNFITTLVTLAVGSNLIAALPGFPESVRIAQRPPSCEDVAARGIPNVNTVCVHRLTIDSGHADWPDGRETNSTSHSAGRGWVITHVSSVVPTNAQQSNANTQFVQGGEVSRIKSELDSLIKELNDYYSKIQSYATIPIKGVPITVGGMTEAIERSRKENQRRLQYTSDTESNVDKVIITATAWGQCKWRIPFSNKCGDGTGGWYKGYVDIYKAYVGIPSEISAERAKTRDTVNNWLNLAEQAKNNPSNSSSSTSTGSSGGGSLSQTAIGTGTPSRLVNRWTNTCLASLGDSKTIDNPVVVAACSGAANTLWEVKNNGEIRNKWTDMCLASLGDSKAIDNPVVVAACSGAANTLWEVKDNGEIRNKWTDMCLASLGDSKAIDNPVVVAACSRNANILWTKQ